jgi:hypothetical protein
MLSSTVTAASPCFATEVAQSDVGPLLCSSHGRSIVVIQRAATQERGRDPIGAFVCGLGSGIVSKLIDYPLDTVKTRLQLCSARASRGAVDCATHVWQVEGVRGFYSGLAAPLSACAVCTAVGFSGFSMGTHLYDRLRAPRSRRRANGELDFDALRVAFGGFVAGGTKANFMTPFEFVKCRMQAQPSRWRGVLCCARSCARNEGGYSVLYRGHGATLLRESFGTAAWFASYETVLHYATSRNDPCPWRQAIAAALSGVAYWTVALPFDNIKTRLQVERSVHGSQSCLRGLLLAWYLEGAMSLFRGYSAVVAKTIPSSIALFATYEWLQREWRAGSVP